MFTKLATEIDFNDIEAFCREWGEGVRVEYKIDIAHIPKIISSFANTQGGIEERIKQSAITGIHPPVSPEVISRDVPGEPGSVVVVVRVGESQEAPHAIQNSTKVYVREGSVTRMN